MFRKRVVLIAVGSSIVLIALIAAATLSDGLFDTRPVAVQAQPSDRPTSSMEQRLNQVIGVLQEAPTCGAAAAAIDDGMDVLYGGLRPLPSKGDLAEQTENVDHLIAMNEMRFAEALGAFARGGGEQGPACDEERRRALDLKLFVEEMNEVAQAVGQFTRQCGAGDSINEAPCSDLQSLLDEDTGEAPPPGARQETLNQQSAVIRPSYSVKLRSPFVPHWFGRWEEDVRVTEPLAKDECAVIFKETKGLMLKLHFERFTIVRDPWVSVFGVPRGTRIPIWSLEWVPSEYVKEWNICHMGKGEIRKTVTQRVKQDIPLNFFWRFYPKDP